MPKLIPLSSKQMKEMGLVSTKKGLMVIAPKTKAKEKVESGKVLSRIEPIKEKPQFVARGQQVTVQTVSKKESKAQHKADMANRGIY